MTSRELAEVMLFGLLVWFFAYCAIMHAVTFVTSLH